MSRNELLSIMFTSSFRVGKRMSGNVSISCSPLGSIRNKFLLFQPAVGDGNNIRFILFFHSSRINGTFVHERDLTPLSLQKSNLSDHLPASEKFMLFTSMLSGSVNSVNLFLIFKP